MTEASPEASSTIDRAALYSLPAYTQLSASQMSLIFSSYALSPSECVASFRELRGGLSNSNFVVESSSGRRALCKVCDEKSLDEVHRQILALLLLRRHHLPIAYPIQRTDVEGSPFTVATGETRGDSLPDPSRYVLCLDGLKPIVLYDFLDGRPPRVATPSVMEQLGCAQAALHCVDGAAFSFLPPFPMGLAAMQPFIDKDLVSHTGHTHTHTNI